MKGLLVFLLLLSFVINVDPKCQPNEILDEQTQKCEPVIIKPVISEPLTTDPASTDQVPTDLAPIYPAPIYPNSMQPTKPNCVGGKIENGKCKCPENKKLLKGVCTLSKNCKNGIFINGKCICLPGFIKKGEFECEVNQCIGGRIVGVICKCPPGQQQKNGRCIAEKLKCKEGELLVNGRCIKNVHKEQL